jgi:hypothetical protein
VAKEYAEHLAAGGDPLGYPDIPHESRYVGASARLISRTTGLIAVYERWNKERGSTNPVHPIQNHRPWRIGEYLHARVGEVVSLQTLAMLGAGGNPQRKWTPNEVANAVVKVQTDALVVRKTKLGGKVAYVLRQRRADEELAEEVWGSVTLETEPTPA